MTQNADNELREFFATLRRPALFVALGLLALGAVSGIISIISGGLGFASNTGLTCLVGGLGLALAIIVLRPLAGKGFTAPAKAGAFLGLGGVAVLVAFLTALIWGFAPLPDDLTLKIFLLASIAVPVSLLSLFVYSQRVRGVVLGWAHAVNAMTWALGAIASLLIVMEIEPGEFGFRLLVSALLFVILAVVSVGVMALLTRKSAPKGLGDATGTEQIAAVKVECPSCAAGFAAPLGASVCPKCSLMFITRIARPLCACGYDLSGTPAGQCPECGKHHAALESARQWDDELTGANKPHR